MTFKEIQNILQKYKYYGLTVKRGEHILSYKFHSISYYAVDIVVNVLKLDKDRIVTKVQIGKIEIDDEKELIPTLNRIGRIQHNILYGKKK